MGSPLLSSEVLTALRPLEKVSTSCGDYAGFSGFGVLEDPDFWSFSDVMRVSSVEEKEVKVSLSRGLYSVGSVFLKSSEEVDLLAVEGASDGVNFDAMAWLMLEVMPES
jgi:hypothetical protein